MFLVQRKTMGSRKMQDKLKIAVTGHTGGLGKIIYDHFKSKNCHVLGISRSTGFDIVSDQDKIVNAIDGFDIFFNVVHVENCQLDLLEKSINKVEKTVVIGSAMHLFRSIATSPYLEEKFKLSETCKNLNIDSHTNTKILHLNISFLPNEDDDPERFVSDNVVEYNQLLSIIDFWIDNPCITDITLGWKLTSVVREGFKKLFPHIKI